MTGRLAHPAWCARGHRCNLGEHRADPIAVNLSGLARGVITRVRAANGDEHAEIRIRLALHPDEATARRQLHTLLTGLDELLGRAVAIAPPTGRRAA